MFFTDMGKKTTQSNCAQCISGGLSIFKLDVMNEQQGIASSMSDY